MSFVLIIHATDLHFLVYVAMEVVLSFTRRLSTWMSTISTNGVNRDAGVNRDKTE